MSLLTVSELRLTLTGTPLDDPDLQILIDRTEQEITDEIGPPGNGSATFTELLQGSNNGPDLYLLRPVDTIATVTNFDSLSDQTGAVLVEGTDFFTWNNEGRLQRISGSFNGGLSGINGLLGTHWGSKVTVEYVPANQNALRKKSIADLVLNVIAFLPVKSEEIHKEYEIEYQSNFELEWKKVMDRLKFAPVI